MNFVEGRVVGDGIIAIKTGGAKCVGGLTGGGNHSLHVEIAYGISTQIVADLLERALIGEQLFWIGKSMP